MKYPLSGGMYQVPRDHLIDSLENFTSVVLFVVAIGFILKMAMVIFALFRGEPAPLSPFIWMFVVIVIIDNYKDAITSFDNGTTALIAEMMPVDKKNGATFWDWFTSPDNAPPGIAGSQPSPDPLANDTPQTAPKEISFLDMVSLSSGATGTAMTLLIGLTNIIATLCAGIAKLIVIVASIVLLLIILPLGLYALAFSYLPTYEEVIKGWLAIFVSIKFWFVVFVIIDLVVNSVTQGMHQVTLSSQAGGGNAFSLTGVLISFILGTSYLLIPFLAGIVIPSQGSQLLTYVMGGAFTAVSMGGAALARGTSAYVDLKNKFSK